MRHDGLAQTAVHDGEVAGVNAGGAHPHDRFTMAGKGLGPLDRMKVEAVAVVPYFKDSHELNPCARPFERGYEP